MSTFQRWLWLAALPCGWLIAAAADPASGRIIKVLPHYLDRDGRSALSPSFYERDAYQAQLRKNPERCSGLRFDVQWKAPRAARELQLRLELKGSKGHTIEPLRVQETVRARGRFSRWAGLTLLGEEFKTLGEVVSWHATLWDGEKLLHEQKSFLW